MSVVPASAVVECYSLSPKNLAYIPEPVKVRFSDQSIFLTELHKLADIDVVLTDRDKNLYDHWTSLKQHWLEDSIERQQLLKEVDTYKGY